VLATASLPWVGSQKVRDWRDSLPFAVLWFIAMMCLFTSFGIVGVVLGNILQSTRGLMSIVLATLLIKLGHLHFEAASTRHVFLRRLASGTVMFAAVSLYVLKDSANIRELLLRFQS
jgi:cytochrome c biogenesis protein CcdA